MDSDSSSDDEFATAGSVTRRKLLADFYGQSTAGQEEDTNAGSRNGGEPTTRRNSNPSGLSNEAASRQTVPELRNSADSKNLDSPYFDVAAHTSHHVVNSSVHKLLEMDEQLTLQVRTLDSTTQNMVYENYSKFIDATEAVKSVGVNVQANEQGLERLKQGMETINEQSRLVEEDLGSLRDAVAEKIRVKRLLTRLDALLKLPETLRDQISQGRYRTAASSFCRSTNILSKHSAGFESLQKIETECNGILVEMIKDLNRCIHQWSGQENALGSAGSTSDDEENNLGSNIMDEDATPLDSPSSISAIFECAGTLAMLDREKLDVGVSVESCMTMSLAASIRYLERLLDTHQLEMQEAAFNTTITPAVGDEGAAFDGDHSARSQQSHKGQHLVPTTFLDALLETATLFRISFQEGNQGISDNETDHLEEFVKEVYQSFLLHVRSVLLDYSFGPHRAEQTTDEDEQDGDGDELYEDVAGAMSILIHAVRELASGLSLPEVGISADIAADMVEQASDLTETLIRRRVDQKFCDLRLRVVSHCLVPFATRIAGLEEDEEDAETPTDERAQMLQVVQIAVSDCLQLLDDTVRSIVSGREELGASAASVDTSMLTQSIQGSTGRFASWLAGTLEALAGCESSESNFSFEAPDIKPVDDDGSAPEGPGGTTVVAAKAAQDDLSQMSNQYDALAEKVDDALQDLIATLEAKGDVYESLDFALKVFEMCRGCEIAFVDMTQSIESNVGGGKTGRTSRSSGLFDDRKNTVLSEHERKTSGRFRLAASRILTLYATNRGFDGANALCSSLVRYADAENESFPEAPSKAACQVLEIAKLATSDCNTLFSEKKGAGPLPSFSGVVPASQPLLAMNSSPLKGLQLDVERMFQQKISIFPHPSNTLDFTRDAILTILFKVVIKAVCEQTRLCSFTVGGFNRLLVDVELLRGMTPHYVDKDYQVEGSDACSALSSLLTEVLNNASERCEDDCTGNEDLIRSVMASLKEFIKSDPDTFRFIIEEQDS